jgi:hypothetical protein
VQALPHGVGGALKPIGPFGGDLSRQNLNESVCETAEAIRSRDVTVERRRIVLRQYEDAVYVRVDAIGNWNVDQAVLATQRNGRFSSLSCKWIQALARASAQYQCQHFFRRHPRSSLRNTHSACCVEQEYNRADTCCGSGMSDGFSIFYLSLIRPSSAITNDK